MCHACSDGHSAVAAAAAIAAAAWNWCLLPGLLPTSSNVRPAAVTHGVCKFPLWQEQQSVLVMTQQQPHKTQNSTARHVTCIGPF